MLLNPGSFLCGSCYKTAMLMPCCDILEEYKQVSNTVSRCPALYAEDQNRAALFGNTHSFLHHSLGDVIGRAARVLHAPWARTGLPTHLARECKTSPNATPKHVQS